MREGFGFDSPIDVECFADGYDGTVFDLAENWP
jgi:hypothetical protein